MGDREGVGNREGVGEGRGVPEAFGAEAEGVSGSTTSEPGTAEVAATAG